MFFRPFSGMRQHTVMLKRETHLEATDILRRQDNQDLSELLQSC